MLVPGNGAKKSAGCSGVHGFNYRCPHVADARDLVKRWLTAFNSRSVEGLLAVAHPEIVLRPLRWVPGREYRGHDGVRKWVDDLTASPHASTLTPTSLDGGDAAVRH